MLVQSFSWVMSQQFRQILQTILSRLGNRGAPQMPRGGGTAIGLIIAAGAGSYGAYHSMVTVQPGHLGLIYNRFGGLNERHVLTEGLNFVIPWFQRAIIYDVRTRPQPIDTQSGSKGIENILFLYTSLKIYLILFDIISADLQMVQISLRVLFKPDPTQLPFIYRRLGKGIRKIIQM